MNETFIETGYYTLLLDGFKNTIIITAGALVIGLVIGVFIAVITEFSKDVPFLKPLAYLCKIYVTAIRGIPIVVLLLVFYYIILKSTDGVVVGILAFGFNSGAYMAELIVAAVYLILVIMLTQLLGVAERKLSEGYGN